MTSPLQLHKGDRYRIVHSVEELAAFETDGWSRESELGKLYIVHTAVEPGDPELALVSQPEESAKDEPILAPSGVLTLGPDPVAPKSAKVRVPIKFKPAE